MKSVFITIISLLAVSATDYCSPKLCSGSTHIGCRNNGAFSRACPAGQTRMVTISNDLKNKILDSHNRKRNTIASGNLRGFRSAVRMATMRWDNELALLASYNVKKCKFDHDRCHSTDTFRYSGQNLGKYWWSGGSITDDQIILGRIEDWWAEHKNANQAQLEKYPSSSSKTIGHFTVMTADKNIAVGCAAIRFPERGMNSLTLACNYAATNIIGRRLYESGSPPASKCRTGRNQRYTALCSPSEVYNVNSV